MRRKIASITHRLRMPAICALCNQCHRKDTAICLDCQKHLPRIKYACYHCALPLPEGDFLICGVCSKTKPYVDQTIAAYRFEEPLRSLLHEFKYHEGLYLCSFFSAAIIQSLPKEALKTQCLVPVPLHPKRLRQRGFNQAAELAKNLGHALNLPYNLFHCKKIVHTTAQASLNEKQRKKNLQHAFASEPLPFQHVTLIDDLLTTGNTVNELAKVLKEQGVIKVDVWCCARAIIM